MADEEKLELGLEEPQGTDQGCPVEMSGGGRCRRQIHSAPPVVDRQPVCLMHSRDPRKSDEEFQEEFERILNDAGDGLADFSGFVFPSSNYAGRTFWAQCIFNGATFTRAADFRDATFTGRATFRRATFTRLAAFRRATFTQDADFYKATFTQDASFFGATFTHSAAFNLAAFQGEALFNSATFTRASDFSGVTFTMAAVFVAVNFSGPADFINTTFTGAANFLKATFADRANFRSAKFAQAVEFRETDFGHDSRREDRRPGPIFSWARFETPETVVFYKTYLGRALFHDCDVTRVTFSNVRWRERMNGKRQLFEELTELDLSGLWGEALRPREGSPDERNYALIAELYQQLKKNYDDRRDYWTAGDFHYGEMEMKRLATPAPGRVARWLARRGSNEERLNRVRQWWHRHMGVAAWYKRASEYGESYGRPVVWLAAVVSLFTLLYPLAGLTPGAKQGSQAVLGPGSAQRLAAPKVSYWALSEFVATEQAGWALGTVKFFGHSLMTTLGVAFFQRDLEYQPVYPWGRALAWAQLLLSYTLAALFLLALRRQFRR